MARAARTADPEEANSAVERAGRLLRAMGTGRPSRGLGLAELALQTRLHKTTALRLLNGLEHVGLVDRGDDGRFHIGLGLVELASAYLEDLDLVEEARPMLEQLAAETGETVHLGVLDGAEIVYVDKCESSQSLRMVSRIGSRNPAHCTAIGKAMLAYAAQTFLLQLLEAGFDRRTPNTIVDLDSLRVQLAEIRARGYAVDREENKLGICCVGAEVRDRKGRVVGAISVSGPSVRILEERLPAIGIAVRRAADIVSKRLGYMPIQEVQ